MLNNGVFFDGSSIAGWKAINESDMILKPDLTTSHVDPFFRIPLFVCDIMDLLQTFYERSSFSKKS